MIPTAMNGFADMPEAAKARLLDTLTLRRWGTPDDVGRAAEREGDGGRDRDEHDGGDDDGRDQSGGSAPTARTSQGRRDAGHLCSFGRAVRHLARRVRVQVRREGRPAARV